jgi:hypothetical protein
MTIDWSNINTWLYGIVMTLVGGIIYLVRRVFTNQAELELLKQRLELYEHYRKEQTAEIKNQLIEIRSDIKSLMR